MKYKYGDVVLCGGHPYLVVGVNNEYGTVDLLDAESCTNNISDQEIKPIGHEDKFKENIKTILTRQTEQYNNVVLENQKQLAILLTNNTFYVGSISYHITGNTKVDGDYVYCQVRTNKDNLYDWVLLDTVLDKLFCK